MKIGHAFVALIAAALVSCAGNVSDSTARDPGAGASPTAQHAAGAAQAMIRPEDIEWKDGPPSLPRGAQYAILEGDPSKEGYFAMRLKLPNGYEVPPHTHPNVERVTIISGTLHLGMGDKRAPGATALPAGSYSFIAARHETLRVDGRGDGAPACHDGTVGHQLREPLGRPAAKAVAECPAHARGAAVFISVAWP